MKIYEFDPDAFAKAMKKQDPNFKHTGKSKNPGMSENERLHHLQALDWLTHSGTEVVIRFLDGDKMIGNESMLIQKAKNAILALPAKDTKDIARKMKKTFGISLKQFAYKR